MCLIMITSSRDIVERNLILDGKGFRTGAIAGERLATRGAVFDVCGSFHDTDS